MFYPRRVLDINDGKPKWSGINNESELIADTPEEHKEAHKKRKLEAEQGQASKDEGEMKPGNKANHNV